MLGQWSLLLHQVSLFESTSVRPVFLLYLGCASQVFECFAYKWFVQLYLHNRIQLRNILIHSHKNLVQIHPPGGFEPQTLGGGGAQFLPGIIQSKLVLLKVESLDN
mgnify:CR=1 FL=1